MPKFFPTAPLVLVPTGLLPAILHIGSASGFYSFLPDALLFFATKHTVGESRKGEPISESAFAVLCVSVIRWSLLYQLLDYHFLQVLPHRGDVLRK